MCRIIQRVWKGCRGRDQCPDQRLIRVDCARYNPAYSEPYPRSYMCPYLPYSQHHQYGAQPVPYPIRVEVVELDHICPHHFVQDAIEAAREGGAYLRREDADAIHQDAVREEEAITQSIVDQVVFEQQDEDRRAGHLL